MSSVRPSISSVAPGAEPVAGDVFGSWTAHENAEATPSNAAGPDIEGMHRVSLRVRTAPHVWYYALSFPLRNIPLGGAVRDLAVEVYYELVAGRIGVGLLGADQQEFVGRELEAEPSLRKLTLRFQHLAEHASVMFRNISSSGASEIVIHGLRLLRGEFSLERAALRTTRRGPKQLLEDQAQLLGSAPKLIFDIGTQDGRSTEDYLLRFPKTRVLGVEADKTNFEASAARLASYNDRCAMHYFALSDRDGRIAFYVNSHDGTHSTLPIGSQEFFKEPSHQLAKVEVDSMRLDTFAARQGIDQIDILKMDIQGGELSALKGAGVLLDQGRIKLLALEVEFRPLYATQPLIWEIGAYLNERGYFLYGLYDEVYHPRNERVLCWADALFVAPSLTRL